MATEPASILVVDDDPDILTAATYLLERSFRTVLTCKTPDDIPTLLAAHKLDVILLDMNFHPGESSGESGLLWLKKILALDPDAVVTMITAHGNADLAVEAMKYGATDYVSKPWDNHKLLATVSAGVKLRGSRKEAMQLRQQNHAINTATQKSKQQILGNSPAMQDLMKFIKRTAPTDANVLILGENGTGKELVAREIHSQSKRRDNIYIPLDLGAITDTLFESELFGHRKGAFTGAQQNRTGYFETANGGTLFLDEIGNVPLHLQAKLLSVLEKRQVAPLGSTTAADIDVRIIAATNMPVAQLQDPNYFRQDLLFRLNTVEIAIPPLRNRREDIPTIAEYFVHHYCQKYGKDDKQLSAAALDALIHYDWPGNVRALRHAVERAVILSTKSQLQPHDFPLHGSSTFAGESSLESTDVEPMVQTGDLNLERLEFRAISQVLKKHRYNISHSAKELGLTRAALYRRMEKYGL
jgi:DNA-binding NtrC family response regulator